MATTVRWLQAQSRIREKSSKRGVERENGGVRYKIADWINNSSYINECAFNQMLHFPTV